MTESTILYDDIEAIMYAIWLMTALGVPWAWKKWRGGRQVAWEAQRGGGMKGGIESMVKIDEEIIVRVRDCR